MCFQICGKIFDDHDEMKKERLWEGIFKGFAETKKEISKYVFYLLSYAGLAEIFLPELTYLNELAKLDYGN